MPSNWPTALDTIEDAPATLAGLPTHSDLHDRLRDAVAAVEAYVGTMTTSRLVQRFESVLTLAIGVPAPVAGMVAWIDTPGALYYYDGTAWSALDNSVWAAPITITLAGDASGSVDFDGSANRTLTVTVGNNSHTHDGSTISALDAGDTTTGIFNIARIPDMAASKITSGEFAVARLPAAITGRTEVESDSFQADVDGSAAAPAFTWDSDPDLGMFRRSWSSGGTNDGVCHSAQGQEVHRVWRNASTGDVAASFHDNLLGVVAGTAMSMETISIDGASRKRYGFATSKRATKTNEQPFEGLTDEQWDALTPKTYDVRNKYVVGDDHITFLDPADVPEGAEPVNRLGLVWEDTAEVSSHLVTPDAPDWDALVTACLAEIKSLRARVAQLEAAA